MSDLESPNQSVQLYVKGVTVVAALGGFLFGYDTGVISGAILYIKEDFALSSFGVELVISIATLGAFFGALSGGYLNDKFGRRPSILMSALIFLVGAIMLAVASDIEALVVGRLIVGFAIGVTSMAVPVYVAEVAPPRQRGALLATIGLFITSGQFISYLIDVAFASVSGGWRWMLGLSVVPALMQSIGMLFLPESPRFLVKRQQVQQARAVLYRSFPPGPSLDQCVEEELARIQDSMREEERGTWHELLTSKHLRPMLIVATTLQAFQQFCGINTAMYYSPLILQMAGVASKQTAILFAVCVAFTNMAVTVLAMFLIDSQGRRRLLLGSLAGVTLGMILLGVSFAALVGFTVKQSDCGAYTSCSGCLLDDRCGWCFDSGICAAGNSTTISSGTCQDWSYASGCGGQSDARGALAVSSLIFYVAFFGVGIGPVPWAIMAEIFPLSIRGKANGLASSVNWICNLIVSISFLSLTNSISIAATFWLYAVLSTLAFVFSYYRVPETKGKTLEQITALFQPRQLRAYEFTSNISSFHEDDHESAARDPILMLPQDSQETAIQQE